MSVGFEEPPATSQIHLGEKSAEKKEELLLTFLIFWFIHRSPLYRAANKSRREGGLQVTLDTSSVGGTSIETLVRFFQGNALLEKRHAELRQLNILLLGSAPPCRP